MKQTVRALLSSFAGGYCWITKNSMVRKLQTVTYFCVKNISGDERKVFEERGESRCFPASYQIIS